MHSILLKIYSIGGNPLLRDINDASPFERLCGMESNDPIVYTFFRDYLLFNYSDQVQIELNAGLQNTLYNWRLPVTNDLLEYGTILDALKTTDSLENFFSQIAATFFKECRSIAYIDLFTSCLIQILLHNILSTRQKLFDTLNQYIDELEIKYQQNPVSLALLSTRKIRQSMIQVNQRNTEQLHLNTHLKNTLLTSK
ncbi:unnamed protein product [Adineta steineri]|uniref:Uncharacterized protein n=1 Tax=Adineta steineri TaxID=433720 RepID=A0A820CDD4_9BILA|nr:unnamed protein product [Adineta steineri]